MLTSRPYITGANTIGNLLMGIITTKKNAIIENTDLGYFIIILLVSESVASFPKTLYLNLKKLYKLFFIEYF